MLSRIMSIDGFFSFVAMPLGKVAVGPATTAFGARGVELGCAAICVLTFAASLTVRPLRELTLVGPAGESPE